MEGGEGNISGGGTKTLTETWVNSTVGDEEEPWNPFLRGKHFNVEAYSNNYHGRFKIIRLLSIADRCGGDERRQMMQLEALRLAYDEAKLGREVKLFTKIVEMISGRLGPNYEIDEDWCRLVNQAVEENENLARQWEEDTMLDLRFVESVRTSYITTGDFYFVHGEFLKALKYYWRSQSFCTSPKTYAKTFLSIVPSLFEMGHFSLVIAFTEKAQEIYTFPCIFSNAQVRCILGLAFLKTQRFRDAALKFLGVSRALGSQSRFIAPHDIATYGGLCALATLERTELKSLVMENDDFQFYLDSAIGVRELICDFYSSRYSACFKHLDNLREWLLLDIHMHDRFETLNDQIRQKAVILCIQPFATVHLETLANIFGTDIEAMERELKALIINNQIQAKIDAVDKVLYARKDQRNVIFQRVLQSCSVIERDLKSMLLNANLTRHHAYFDNSRAVSS